MKYLPVFLKLNGRPCLVVGGGKVAARKVALLARSGADITVVAPSLCDTLTALRKQGSIKVLDRGFQDGDIDGKVLVIAATDDEKINRQVSVVANGQRIPVNVVDCPELCSFIMPSLIDRAPVQVAVSTGGASPVLARLLRARLESFIPAAYGHLATLVNEFRQQVKDRFPVTGQRRYFWESV
ncbi:MAG: NAD(P)-dependent oxidoreductase, partial [Pseudomonadota bacterium]|nr:NAD(P)-dependent oxidoreductase [Pseudomonadota bacterium]